MSFCAFGFVSELLPERQKNVELSMLSVHCHRTLVGKMKNVLIYHSGGYFTPFASVTCNIHDLQKNITSYQLYLQDKSNFKIGKAVIYQTLIIGIIQATSMFVLGRRTVKQRGAMAGNKRSLHSL